jgi:hypothetical protein
MTEKNQKATNVDLFGSPQVDQSKQLVELANVLEGELLEPDADYHERDVRSINKQFALAEYDDSWTKMEWLLFLEIYETIRKFYLGNDDSNILEFSAGNIRVKIPIASMDEDLFKKSNRSKQLRSAADGLQSKRARRILEADDEGQLGFDFITMFPRITYNPKEDKENLYVTIQSEIYEEMVPIKSVAQHNYDVLKKLNTGNDQRVYSVMIAYAPKTEFDITFDELRRQLGFHEKGSWKIWRRFNAKVLKPAVEKINQYKHYDIEVSYFKPHGRETISFKVKRCDNRNKVLGELLSLDDIIPESSRVPNQIQRKYISTMIENCKTVISISNPDELTSWIVSDLINQQVKSGKSFNFKHAINAISKQIRHGIYKMPYCHEHLLKSSNVEDPGSFHEGVYKDIVKLEREGKYGEIRLRYSDHEIEVNRCGHLIAILRDL